MKERYFLCVDLKTFYASVECIERNLDPMITNLVVSDSSRGRGAITLAITPAMKKLGVKNRCRLYEIPQNINYITALPRMQKYIEYACDIYEIYLKYFSKDDIHVYSIDECFIDITSYLTLYNKKPHDIALILKLDILHTLKIHCAIGIGTNIYLSKVALDVLAKDKPMGIEYLNENRYKKMLGNHQPLNDFFYIGSNIQKSLNDMGLFTMNDICNFNEIQIYEKFGRNGLYLYDHAHGRDGTLIQDIKGYKKKSNSMSLSQILFEDYTYEDTKLIIREMVDDLCLRLVKEKVMSNHISLAIGYSNDVRGMHCSRKIEVTTQTFSVILPFFIDLFNKNVDRELKIRQVAVGCANFQRIEQYTIFDDIDAIEESQKIQEAIGLLKDKYGKNSVVKASSMTDKSTAIKRNSLLGGHNRE